MRQTGTLNRNLPPQEGPRINDRIRVPEVRVIGDDGAQLGVMPVREALARAEELGLDLVEVAPEGKPPVCRLMDFGKYKYMQQQKAKEAKKKAAVVEIKELQLTPTTDRHDIETKGNNARRWLEEKNRVRVNLKFRGREVTHADVGYRVLNELMAIVGDLGVQEAPPKMEGKNLRVTILPKGEKS